MRITRFILPALLANVAVILGGCSKQALVYGERNSLSVASVQVNDNAAEPLRVNIAFRRTIAMQAPPLGTKESKSLTQKPLARALVV